MLNGRNEEGGKTPHADTPCAIHIGTEMLFVSDRNDKRKTPTIRRHYMRDIVVGQADGVYVQYFAVVYEYTYYFIIHAARVTLHNIKRVQIQPL